MVAYFCRDETSRFWPRYDILCPMGLPVLKVALPPSYSPCRWRRLSRRLSRGGLRRFLTEERAPEGLSLAPVSPLPLCRAKGAELALALLSGLPLHDRRVALRGEAADPAAWALAEALCPQVGALLLDFDRGEEALSRRLRERYGAAPLHLGQGSAPQVWVELSPRPDPAPGALRLWGEPELRGLTLTTRTSLPPELPRLPLLELLWETGRVSREQILVRREE